MEIKFPFTSITSFKTIQEIIELLKRQGCVDINMIHRKDAIVGITWSLLRDGYKKTTTLEIDILAYSRELRKIKMKKMNRSSVKITTEHAEDVAWKELKEKILELEIQV